MMIPIAYSEECDILGMDWRQAAIAGWSGAFILARLQVGMKAACRRGGQCFVCRDLRLPAATSPIPSMTSQGPSTGRQCQGVNGVRPCGERSQIGSPFCGRSSYSHHGLENRYSIEVATEQLRCRMKHQVDSVDGFCFAASPTGWLGVLLCHAMFLSSSGFDECWFGIWLMILDIHEKKYLLATLW